MSGEDQDGAAWGLHPRRVRRSLAVNMQKGVQEDTPTTSHPSAGAFAYPPTLLQHRRGKRLLSVAALVAVV